MVHSSALGHSGEMTLSFRGENLSLLLDPNVAIPNYYTSIILEYLETYEFAGHTIADVGSGTGVISIVANLFLGSKEVWAIDINTSAVELTRRNCVRNECHLDQITIEYGDIEIARPKNSIDLLIANPPQIPSLEDTDPTCSGGATGRAIMEKILWFANCGLSKTGTVLMTAAEFIDIQAMCSFCDSLGFHANIVSTKSCKPGPYTLRHRDYIEQNGYTFSDDGNGLSFLLHLLSITRKVV